MKLKTTVWRRLGAFFCAIVGLFLVTELALRIGFAFGKGAKVFGYGIVETPYDEYFDPKGAVRRYDQRYVTTAFHENTFEHYSKYYPNQPRIHPDVSGVSIPATINANGFRGAPFEAQKPAKVTRIITIGASATFGFRTRDQETFPRNLEILLNEGAAASRNPDRKYQVYNLAIPHLQSDEICSLLLAEGIPLQPDIVVFYEGFTDAAGAPRDGTLKSGVKRMPFATTAFRELRQRLICVALIGKMTSIKYSNVPDKAAETPWEKEAEVKRTRFIGSLQKMNDACVQHGIRFVVVSQQAASLLFTKDTIKGVSYEDELKAIRESVAKTGEFGGLQKTFLIHHDLMAAEKSWAKSNGVYYIDAIKAMDGNRDLLIDWMHLNSQGNLLLAKTIKDHLPLP